MVYVMKNTKVTMDYGSFHIISNYFLFFSFLFVFFLFFPSNHQSTPNTTTTPSLCLNHFCLINLKGNKKTTHISIIPNHKQLIPHPRNRRIREIRAIHQTDAIHRPEDQYQSAIDFMFDFAAFFRREPVKGIIFIG